MAIIAKEKPNKFNLKIGEFVSRGEMKMKKPYEECVRDLRIDCVNSELI